MLAWLFGSLSRSSACAALVFSLAAAQAQPAPPVPIPVPQNRPYLGPLVLQVDATDLDHRLLQVRQTVPVKPGPLVLLYPQWLPGTHGPSADITRLAGLIITGAGKRIEWLRDTLEPYAFRLTVPKGVDSIELSFQHLAPITQESGRVSVTPAILGVQWNTVLLYPAGHDAQAIEVKARLRLPPGWQQGSGLRAADGTLPMAGEGGWVDYGKTTLETLVDSPVFAGRYFKRIELDAPGTQRPVALNLFGDDAAQIEADATQIEAHKKLVLQADKLFGARHFAHYDFLLAISKNFSGIGLEHHESSENAVRPGYFKDWAKAVRSRGLLPHEYVHSWDGKFRRPADLLTPNFNVPMQDTLLWVYEGQTTYWGDVLTPRSGLGTPEQARDRLAYDAAALDARLGRTWRNLQDTTNEAVMQGRRRSKDWLSWQRGSDYYPEATLIWLDADTLIREKSQGKRSLDDFAKGFFGVQEGRPLSLPVRPLPYTFDDVVKALNAVQPHDWAKFLRDRLDSYGPGAPLDGLARSGWKLVYTEKESEFAKAPSSDDEERSKDFAYSLGLRISAGGQGAGGRVGRITEVLWDSPAFKAGLAPSASIEAVNLRAYDADRLAAAITANKGGAQPIELLLRDGDQFRNVRIDYRGGLRYPKLERIEGTPDRLTEIFAPRG